MTQTKTEVTITLGPETIARVRAAVAEGRAPSVSAYIEHAVTGQLDTESGFDATIAEMLASTGGPATDEERATARRLLSTGVA